MSLSRNAVLQMPFLKCHFKMISQKMSSQKCHFKNDTSKSHIKCHFKNDISKSHLKNCLFRNDILRCHFKNDNFFYTISINDMNFFFKRRTFTKSDVSKIRHFVEIRTIWRSVAQTSQRWSRWDVAGEMPVDHLSRYSSSNPGPGQPLELKEMKIFNLLK